MDPRAVWLASLYAMGHAAAVVALGLAALSFRAILPEWIDPVIERLVGMTLVVLGVWLAYSLARYWRGEAEFRLRSRWMLLVSGMRRAWRGVQARLHGHAHDGAFHVHAIAQGDQYGPKAAFGTGLLVSNSAVALLASAGFVSAGKARRLYVLAGCLTAVFSLAIGTSALLGVSDHLPDLQALLTALFGEAPA